MKRILLALLLTTLTIHADSGMKIPGEKNSCSNWTATSTWDDFVDCVFVRPVSFVLLGGVAFPAYVVSAPFASMADAEREDYTNTVQKPAAFVFDREIGDLSTSVEDCKSK
jgi:hypothetical protein